MEWRRYGESPSFSPASPSSALPTRASRSLKIAASVASSEVSLSPSFGPGPQALRTREDSGYLSSAVFTISIGAMIGSGIFVLPGLAAEITGPSVMLAFLLAGVVVLPAALSKSEMATAMPEAGGTYLYIDRAMGPLMGTVAGFGVWFALVFKAAFALAGLGGYLALLTNVDVKLVSLVADVA